MQSTTLRTLIAAASAGLLLASMAGNALAREGAGSIGHGIKCYQTVVQNADGSYSVKQVCYKSI